LISDIGGPQTGAAGAELTFTDLPPVASGFYRIRISSS
jgi:hypothetical protein